MSLFQRITDAIMGKKTQDSFGGGVKIISYDELMASGKKLVINKDTSYRVGETNKMALGYKRIISQMVARYGIEIADEDGNLIDDKQTVKNIVKFFGGNQLKLTVSDYFDEYFDNGQIFAVPSQMNGLGLATDTIKILDGKSMTIETNKYGKPVRYEYGLSEKFIPDLIVDHIIFRDRYKKAYGSSAYAGVIIDALTNDKGSRSQYRFMANNKMPGTIIVLKDRPEEYTADEIKEYNRTWKKKFGGDRSGGEPYVTDNIDNVITLDASNVDADFLNIKKDNDDGFATVFLLDPRLIALQKKTGSYGEVEITVLAQANTQIETYANHFASWLQDCYIRFVDPYFPYHIRCKNGKFRNIMEEKKVAMMEREKALIRGEEYRELFGYEHDDHEAMQGYYMNKGFVKVGDPVTKQET